MELSLDQLIEYDKEVFLALNGSSSIFMDGFMWIYTSTVIWIPLAAYMLYIIIKNNKLKQTLFIVVSIALVVLLCDQISSGFFKPFFKRLRPGHDLELMYIVDVVNGYRGGRYGFISSHAANSFGLFAFTALLFKNRGYTFIMFVWAFLTSFTRIYLGVHFIGDILCGALLGVLIGCGLYYSCSYLINKTSGNRILHTSSGKYTASGYQIADIRGIITVFYSLLFLKTIIGMFLYDFKLL